MPVVLFQMCLGVLSGSRSAVLFTLVALLLVLVGYGVPIRWRSLILPGLIAVILAVSISGMRSLMGRSIFEAQTNMQRIESLTAGAKVALEYGLPPEVLQDFVYRFDGNAFGGLIVAGYEAGIDLPGLTPILNNFLLTVPSFLYPSKLEAGIFGLSEKDYLVNHFRMSGFHTEELHGELEERADIDFIPGVWGILFGAFGSIGVLLSAALLGWGYAAMDTWRIRSRSLLAGLIWIGSIWATLTYEQGIRVLFLTGRATFALFLVLILLRKAKTIMRIVGSRTTQLKPFEVQGRA